MRRNAQGVEEVVEEEAIRTKASGILVWISYALNRSPMAQRQRLQFLLLELESIDRIHIRWMHPCRY